MTSHLESKGTNELDLFITDASKKPLTVSADKLQASVAIGDSTVLLCFLLSALNVPEMQNAVVFEPAPAEERPKGEKGSTCSHYVAKAGFMKVRESLLLCMKSHELCFGAGRQPTH